VLFPEQRITNALAQIESSTTNSPNQGAAANGASRLAHRQIERHRRLAPVAELRSLGHSDDYSHSSTRAAPERMDSFARAQRMDCRALVIVSVPLGAFVGGYCGYTICRLVIFPLNGRPESQHNWIGWVNAESSAR